MRWFLDMCIILYYVAQDNSYFYKKSFELLNQNKGNIFLVCFYIIDKDIPKYLKRQRIIIDEVLKKVRDENYIFGSSDDGSFLYDRDKQKAEKLYLQSKSVKDKITFINKVKESQKGQELLIEYLLKTKIEKVIPIGEIDQKLRSAIFTYLEGNISDANILASGVQEHKNKELVLLTGDKNHWTKDNLQWAIENNSELDYEIPLIKYIQNI
ncbi:hypothetical protein A3K73_00650 [Candidatus Pacearchaeota archaeon RBG_13_36_9]|nr:MAG: hypothetical protein A3K73_00650 [Candidatus Pacearchaeota archaeon RBG_13_36_9]